MGNLVVFRLRLCLASLAEFVGVSLVLELAVADYLGGLLVFGPVKVIGGLFQGQLYGALIILFL